MVEECRADADQRQHEVQAEQVALDHELAADDAEQAHALVVPELGAVGQDDARQRHVQQVVERDRQGDDERLADLDAVDTGEDVDAVGREGRQERHVEVVEGA